MERLSRLVKKTRVDGSLGGVKISEVSYLSHLLFVDDVLMLSNGSMCDTTCFKKILSLFCKATCMEPNFIKSTILQVSCLQNEQRHAIHHFQFVRQELETGVKYLRFRLKPNGYHIAY